MSDKVMFPDTNIVEAGNFPIRPFDSQIAGTASFNILHIESDHSRTEEQ